LSQHLWAKRVKRILKLEKSKFHLQLFLIDFGARDTYVLTLARMQECKIEAITQSSPWLR
jgi:hypothetical protein